MPSSVHGRLVVPDELAIGVGGEGRLARAREAEQDGGITALTDVRRAVHRHVTLLGELEVHDGEHALLDDAAVVGAAHDERDLVLEVEDHGALGERAIDLGVGAVGRHVEHRPAVLRLVRHTLVPLREHVVGEHRVRGELADDAVGTGRLRITPTVDVHHVERRLLLVEVRDRALEQGLVRGGVELLEVRLPPDPILELGPRDTEGVGNRTTGARGVAVVDERTIDAELRSERLLVVVGTVELHATAVVRDRLMEELVLREGWPCT